MTQCCAWSFLASKLTQTKPQRETMQMSLTVARQIVSMIDCIDAVVRAKDAPIKY